MLKLFISVPFFCVLLGSVNAQNVNNTAATASDPIPEYNRNAITVVLLENTTGYNTDLLDAIKTVKISDKYDNNMVQSRSMVVGTKTSQALTEKLNEEKIPNQILAKWFARSDSGQFDMSVVYKRGMYNATDDEVVKASSSKVGIARLQDAGEQLIDHSYILVLDFYGIQSMQQKYDKTDEANKAYAKKNNTEFKPVKRTQNGWTGEVNGYLFKLNFSDSLTNLFYTDLWINENDDAETRAAKRARFDNTNFPVQYIMKYNASADGTQFNADYLLAPPTQLTRKQLFQKMMANGIDGITFEMERKLERFKVKTVVYKTHPTSAKIGKKEGLITDQRYYITEIKQKGNGEMVAKRKGVVRVKKVTDNRTVATGKTDKYSTFYQTSGLRIDPGMTMQQRPDLGIGVSGGASFGGIGGGYVKLELNVARFTSAIMDIGIPQLKIFGAIGFDARDYKIKATSIHHTYTGISFFRWQAGLSKGFYFGRNFSVALFGAYGMETASNKDLLKDLGLEDDNNINVEFINFGTYATINVTHFIQLMGAINIYTPITDAYDKDKEKFTDFRKYTDFFDNRKGLSFDVGVRIEF